MKERTRLDPFFPRHTDFMKSTLIFSSLLLTASMASGAPAAPAVLPLENARRIEVLFLGAPTANGPHHDPIERYREVRKHLGTAGINFTYTESLSDLKRDVLDRYDAVVLYANWDRISPEQEKALLSYVEDGHGFVPIHSASACFGNSDAFIKLVGARFKSHGAGVFKTDIVAPNHPIMRGYEGFETWDETYVHDRHNEENRTLLQKREQEPWTWIRTQGKGRIFYTAYGHDMRTWSQEGFNELVRRGILWSVSDSARAKLLALKLPQLETETVQLPGYRQRKTITEAQKPLPPTESMKLVQVPQGMEVSLFASEPDIVNPIAVAWDERGRAFVVETVDYPNNLQSGNLGHDSIKICEDTNGDGRADKFTVFADKLSIPTSLVFANGGVICTNGSELLFLKDTNGDDKADVRQVLFSGFKMHDTHAGPSSLRYGFDNWIYATIGYSGFDGTVGGKQAKFGNGLFRFKQDGSKVEFLQSTTNNTWGLGFTSDFDILGSTANGNPSWYFTFPQETYSAVGLNAPKTPRADNDNPLLFPISMDIRQVDQFDKFTAGCGHGFVTSTRMPAEYRDRIAFVSEPTAKFTGSFEVSRKGTGYYAKLLPNNIFASADAWTSPVYVEEGPDGAVWVCDWYNLIIQHNPTPNRNSAGYDARNGKGNAYESPHRDTKFGRIYRVYPQGSKDEVKPKLNVKAPATLVEALHHPNLIWRQHAQRLIVDNKVTATIPALKKLVSANEPGAIQAVYTLDGLGALDAATRNAAATSKLRGVRRAARLTAPADDASWIEAFISNGVIKAEDTRELAEILVAFGQVPASDAAGKAILGTLLAKSQEFGKDDTLKDAWQIAARGQASGVLVAAAELPAKPSDPAKSTAPQPNLIPNPDFNQPNGWTLRNYVGQAEMTIVNQGRNGGSALQLKSGARADSGASADIPVSPQTRYRLSGWIKTENVAPQGGRGALLNVHGMGADSPDKKGTTDWSEVSVEFNSGNANSVRIHCLLGGYGGATGTAWFDDLSLVSLGTASADPASDLGSWLAPAASRLANKGTDAQKNAAVTALTKRGDDLAKTLVGLVGTAPAKEEGPAEKKFKVDEVVHHRGEDIYSRICSACHGTDGKGVPGAFPPLDGSEWVVNDPTVPIKIVTSGLQGPIEVKGQKFNSVMPGLADLKDEEVADVLTFVRQSWSNDAAPVKAEDVKKVRATPHPTPWTAAELKK
jgi:putative membrane-bound dehydrogenase-like protein